MPEHYGIEDNSNWKSRWVSKIKPDTYLYLYVETIYEQNQIDQV